MVALKVSIDYLALTSIIWLNLEMGYIILYIEKFLRISVHIIAKHKSTLEILLKK